MASIAVLALLAAAGCVPASGPSTSTKAVPEGSGCPPSGSTLGSGVWYGLIKAGSTTSALKVDPVCYFVADVDKAAAEDGVDAYNSYVRNTSMAVLTVPVCAGAKFALITHPAPSSATVSAATFVQQMPAGITSATYPQDTPIAAVVIGAGKTCVGMGLEAYIP